MRRKMLSAYFAAQILFLVFASTPSIMVQVPGVQASQTVVAVVPANVSASVGEGFSVNITIFDVQNLYGLAVTLSWNSSILQLVGIDDRLGQADGVLNQPVFVAQNSTQENSYVIAAASTNPAPPFNGTGNVAELNFEVVGVGDSELNLEATLQDYPPPDRFPPISMPIDHATINGVAYGIVSEFLGYSLVVVLIVLAVVVVVFARSRQRRLIRPPESNTVRWLE